jgi:hypothetical protein
MNRETGQTKCQGSKKEAKKSRSAKKVKEYHAKEVFEFGVNYTTKVHACASIHQFQPQATKASVTIQRERLGLIQLLKK